MKDFAIEEIYTRVANRSTVLELLTDCELVAYDYGCVCLRAK